MRNKNILNLSLLLLTSLLLSLAPPKPRPNIIIIMADDMGYSDIGSFGSEIRTPHLDALAAGGLKMTNFYNASRCCPTRASLLTGLYPHQAGVGDMVNDRGHPSYQGYLNQSCVTIAEALKPGGYRTLMAGKWHVGEKPEHWPRQRGFDRYFGLINGASSYFDLRPYRPNQTLTLALDDIPVTPGEGFYATDAYTDYALKFIEEAKGKTTPFFLYLPYTAPHWPLHALPEDIARYRGKYKQGWDQLREERYARMLQLGIIHPTTKLSPRHDNVPAWAELTEEEKDLWEEKMAVYAAMIDRMDQNIGRLRQKLQELGQEQNTVILFLADNGGSHERIAGGGFAPAVLNGKRSSDPDSFTAYEYPWANVSNTPFRLFKHWELEGGIATPFIAYFPALIKPGAISTEPAHVIDLMATALDLAGMKYPTTYQGHSITPLEGKSLKPVFQGKKRAGHEALFFEHEGNRAVRQGDWKIVSSYPETTWQLYNLRHDRSELTDLSARHPEKVKELEGLYQRWAARAGVVSWEELTARKK
jgi:arylsulfatase A-like enzyme